jgi:hypothetical protein
VLLIVGIAATAAVSVLLYARWMDRQPEMAAQSTRRAQQLAAVVLVLSRAVEGVLDALSYGVRPEPVMSGRRATLGWDEEDYR